MVIRFILNGKKCRNIVDSSTRLIDLLREGCGITSVREGCGAGECGSCTVLLNGNPVCSCLTPAVQVRNCEIITIDGLERDGELALLQKAFLDNDAVQCGFCTPGMILTAKALLDKNPNPSKDEIRHALGGNICRCTGYIPILRAVEAAAKQGRTTQ
ncbi:(2Fe-2S)-binding protein [Treponema primitia]|uniref:(2Fe-2S)-binding protein n=1 Tax=Treponema primitia TaxID=88058 RepID=UPI0002554F9C|nr:(2Fe-2S)-binding protein [Treponema primitia]